MKTVRNVKNPATYGAVLLNKELFCTLVEKLQSVQGQKVSEPNAVIKSKGQGNNGKEMTKPEGEARQPWGWCQPG